MRAVKADLAEKNGKIADDSGRMDRVGLTLVAQNVCIGDATRNGGDFFGKKCGFIREFEDFDEADTQPAA
jgi:hypothetical protein